MVVDFHRLTTDHHRHFEQSEKSAFSEQAAESRFLVAALLRMTRSEELVLAPLLYNSRG